MNNSANWEKFYREINQPEERIHLAKTALCFAGAVGYPQIDIEDYLNILENIALEIKAKLPERLYPLKVIKCINQHLFQKLGFRGNTNHYYDPRNSFLNEVIDSRRGIPITLAITYLEIARILDFTMLGIGLPGHFLIRPDFEDCGIFVDVFHEGEILFEDDCVEILRQVYGQPVELEPHFFEPVSNKQILARMLTNLKFIYLNRQQLSKALEVVQGIIAIFPQHYGEMRDRGLLYYQLGELAKASQDLKIYLAMVPDAGDANSIRKFLEKFS